VTKARAWPNNAARARDEAAMDIQQVIKNLRVLRDDPNVTRTELLYRVGYAIDYAQNAVRWLESAGAPTVPIE